MCACVCVCVCVCTRMVNRVHAKQIVMKTVLEMLHPTAEATMPASLTMVTVVDYKCVLQDTFSL